MSKKIPQIWLMTPTTDEYKAEKKAKGLCATYRCRRPIRRTGSTQCHTCASRCHRLRDDVRYAYANLRCSARKRGIGFDLTLAQFRTWCKDTGYDAKRGRAAGALSCDRKDENGPYAIWNIRPMEYVDNSSHRYEGGKEYSLPESVPVGVTSTSYTEEEDPLRF